MNDGEESRAPLPLPGVGPDRSSVGPLTSRQNHVGYKALSLDKRSKALQRLDLYLADAFACHAHDGRDLFERRRFMIPEPKATA